MQYITNQKSSYCQTVYFHRDIQKNDQQVYVKYVMDSWIPVFLYHILPILPSFLNDCLPLIYISLIRTKSLYTASYYMTMILKNVLFHTLRNIYGESACITHFTLFLKQFLESGPLSSKRVVVLKEKYICWTEY